MQTADHPSASSSARTDCAANRQVGAAVTAPVSLKPVCGPIPRNALATPRVLGKHVDNACSQWRRIATCRPPIQQVAACAGNHLAAGFGKVPEVITPRDLHRDPLGVGLDVLRRPTLEIPVSCNLQGVVDRRGASGPVLCHRPIFHPPDNVACSDPQGQLDRQTTTVQSSLVSLVHPVLEPGITTQRTKVPSIRRCAPNGSPHSTVQPLRL